MTLAELKALIAKHTQAVEATDTKAMTGTLKSIGDAIAEMETSGGFAGTKAFDDLAAQLKQMRTDVDTVIDAQRRAEKNGMLLRGAAAVIPGGRAARLEMLKDGRAFTSDETARRFGASVTVRLVRLGLIPQDLVPKSIMEFGDSVWKDAEVTPDIATSGGNLIIDEVRPEIIRNVEAMGRVFTRCRRVPLVTTGTTTIGKRTGGLTATPTAAGALINRTAPTLGTITLTPQKWAMIVAVCNEFYRQQRLLADLGQWLGVEIAYGFAYAFDDAVINGDGTAAYGNITGILQSATITAVAAANTHTTAATLAAADFDTFLAGLSVEYALAEAEWYMHLSVERVARALRTATDALPIFERGGGREPNTLNGYPYTISSRFPAASAIAAGTKFGAFGDLRLSHVFGMIGDITVDTSRDALFENDMTAIRALAHVDCQEADADAVVVLKAAAA
ncbi:MAG: phage major capsid protein [Planctomycetes bacterium]|nr:phage major capsid protein [Planctomycetota bacterium]